MRLRKNLLYFILSFAALGLSSCNDDQISASNGTNSEVATTAISGSASTSEGTIAFHLNSHPRPSYLAQLKHAINPITTAWAVPSCNWSSLMSSCDSEGVETLTFDGCSSPLDPAIRIEGSESL